ncbi:type II secretion system F family protein [Providencia sp. Me31A]|uniref:type II secretion system F family protein n=1 Tax=Providencia sp. Me31A TaxID=3392637 RepID=UPI003D2CCDB0
MFIYSYIATDINNNLVKNTIIAKDKKNAFIEITKNNLTPLKIKFQRFFILNLENINYRTHFFHQLSILSSSGINLVQCLKVLKSNCQLPFWISIITNSIQHLEKGEKLSQYFANYPLIFNETIISLILVAEKTGQYDESFRAIVSILEHNEKTLLLIKKATRYPLILSLFSVLLLIIMMLYVVPQFNDIYQNFQQELPLLTKVIILISETLKSQFFCILLLFFLFIASLFKFKEKYILLIQKLIIYIPFVKKAIRIHYLSLYFLTMYSTIKVGLSLSECLACTIHTISNQQYNKDCKLISNLVDQGELLSDAMKKTNLFPTLSIQLISIAEESGRLNYFTKYLFKYYSEQYIIYSERSLKNLEPILLAIMAILVGVIMLAMYLPIFNLGNVISEL